MSAASVAVSQLGVSTLYFHDHYCIGTHIGHYLHIDGMYDEERPQLIVFESRRIARRFRNRYADDLKVFELRPTSLINDDLDIHESYMHLCVDVRDGDTQFLQLSWWEFFDRQRHMCLLSHRSDPIVADRVEVLKAEVLSWKRFTEELHGSSEFSWADPQIGFRK